MTKKLNILMICSWVRHDSNIGIFFREQSKLLSSSFDIYLASFIPVQLGIRSLLRTRALFKIEEVQTPEGLLLYYVSFPSFYFFPNRTNEALKNIAVKKLNRILIKKSFKPNLIHAQSIFDAGFWAHRFYEKFNLPYIITEHNQISFANKTIQDFNKTKNILKYSKVNCVVSLDKIRQFAANGLFFEFLNVGNSIDETIFNFQGQKEDDSFKILTVGAFHPIKDQKSILNALKKLDELNESNTKEIKFTWIGYEGWGEVNEENVRELVKSYHFKKIQIQLIKSADRNFIATEMKLSNVFVLSSLSEGMPVSVLESLACGTPVISTNCGGVDEIITEKNGKIVQIQDFNSIFYFLNKIMKKEIKFDAELISTDLIEKFGSMAFKEKMTNIYNKSIL